MQRLLRFYQRRRVSPVVAAIGDVSGNVAQIEANRPRIENLEQPVTTHVSTLSNIISTFFDFAAVLCVTPFRIAIESNSDSFVIKKCVLHEICCVIMHLMCIARLLTEIRQTIDFEIVKLPPSIKSFKVVNVLTMLVYKVLTIWRLWVNQNNYLKIFQRVHNTPSFSSINFKILWKPYVFGLFMVPVLQIFTSTIYGKGFVPLSEPWSTTFWSHQLVKYARYSFFVDNSGQDFYESTNVNWNIWDVPISLLTLIGSFQRHAVGTFYDILLTSFSATLWLAVRSFVTDIKRDTENLLNYEQVLARLEDLAKLSSAINEALGNHAFWYLAESALYFAVNLTKVATNPHALARLDALIFYLIFLGNLLISANIQKQLGIVNVWLKRGSNKRYYDCNSFNALNSTREQIGIDIEGTCTISNSFIAAYAAVVVSYFLICIQDGFKISMSTAFENHTSIIHFSY